MAIHAKLVCRRGILSLVSCALNFQYRSYGSSTIASVRTFRVFEYVQRVHVDIVPQSSIWPWLVLVLVCTWDTVPWVLGVRSARFFLALFFTWPLRVTLDSSRVIEEQPYAIQLCQVQRKHQANRPLGAGLQRCWFVSACPIMLLDADGCGCALARRMTTKTAFQFAAF